MRFHVYYMKPDFFSTGIMGVESMKRAGKMPSVDKLRDTHAFVKTIEAYQLKDVFAAMQAFEWSPNGEARSIIEKAGLAHTSMSVGDIAIDHGGNAYVVDSVGWKELKTDSKVA